MSNNVIIKAAHDGNLTNVRTILLTDYLLANWGKEHILDSAFCFCNTRMEGEVIIHNRMPWEAELCPN